MWIKNIDEDIEIRMSIYTYKVAIKIRDTPGLKSEGADLRKY